MARGLSESSGNLILPNNSVLQLSTFRRQCRVSASSIVLHCSHIGGDAVEVHVGGETRHDLETVEFWRPNVVNGKQKGEGGYHAFTLRAVRGFMLRWLPRLHL